MSEPIHIISLGAGVQSSTMALMAAAGEILPMPKCAIFADTQAEPKSVYTWLDWLENQLPFPVRRCTAGSLVDDALRIRERKDKTGFWSPSAIPHFSINADGGHGHGPRQCTHDFKLLPLAREARLVMTEHGVKKCIVWIGISSDESLRVKPSRVSYSEHRWPLIELEMRRRNCLEWMAARGFPIPPRSACVFCPYHNNTEWRRLKNEEPLEFEKAAQFERDYQATKKTTLRDKNVQFFLHSKRIPLSEVDFSTEEEKGQLNMFNNECEGMCGV